MQAIESPSEYSLEEALAELDRVAPHAPLLALGQTVFWDEPLKAGVALAAKGRRRFVAGIHDTDYFAKLPGAPHQADRFKIVPHNDTTTKDLWSAAAEFSSLFGSETVVKRDALLGAGLRLRKVAEGRPQLLDAATEAWGWRAVVSLAENPPVSAEVALPSVLPELRKALVWAMDASLECTADHAREDAEAAARSLLEEFDAAATDAKTLSNFYQALLPKMLEFVAKQSVEAEITATTDLLRFNRQTSARARFDLVNLFLDPETAATATECYNAAVAGSEIYGLDRFGTGALPFDLVVPGHGRGTLRIGHRAIIIMTPNPLFINLAKPIRSVADLAEAIELKFGEGCTLIGKAVTLIGMLAREHVFVFHEGASSYVKASRQFHQSLIQKGIGFRWNPILRVRYGVWDALEECQTWLKLPEPLRGPFGASEICAPSFAARWKSVVEEQAALLKHLGTLKSPLELIRFLDGHAKGAWQRLSDEYQELHSRLQELEQQVQGLRTLRRSLYVDLRTARQARLMAEKAKGDHFRSAIFEQEPSSEALAERERLSAEVEAAIKHIDELRHRIRSLMREQTDAVRTPEVLKVHERRRAIEVEAELKRLSLIREAVVVSKGLAKSNHRPSAWWFPILCPDGGWFNETISKSRCYLEPLES